MESPKPSPLITHLSWGRIEVEGQTEPYKDAKLLPGGSREWDWNETGTRHVPGIQPADIEELLAHGTNVVVLSKGVYKRLHVCADTLDVLKAKKIPVHVRQTKNAGMKDNELAKKNAVGGLFHSTC